MKTTLFLNLFLLFCFFLINPSKSDNISNVCAKTKNPNFCTLTLESIPNAKTSSLIGLELIMLNFTRVKANATRPKIDALIMKDPVHIPFELLDSLTECGFDYRNAVNLDLPQATTLLVHKQFLELSFMANATADRGIMCENEFKKRGIASPLTKENNELISFGNIMQVIADILRGTS
ncbi:PREDICTED: pectinesterase inhibitor-like [Nicotiana attenuata]|uniref:Pectinesterase inhibitor domain-containing protein n=1 Tax=Nicotiana attenuata TaxID=49451 RepID=A0A314KJF9_NICAT|nr:PREDICTED: pectinesterase inhibitor-like [Nicotiana attenuata]OIT29485.1 hypothetical protein A4A49_17258 [Nicotiana attenuata]